MHDETPADRLREAAGLIRTDGHRRGALVDRWGNRCALGAILRVTCGNVKGQSTEQRLQRDPIALAAATALGNVLPSSPDIPEWFAALEPEKPHHRVAYWSDCVVEDGEEVAALMEKVAAGLEEQA